VRVPFRPWNPHPQPNSNPKAVTLTLSWQAAFRLWNPNPNQNPNPNPKLAGCLPAMEGPAARRRAPRRARGGAAAQPVGFRAAGGWRFFPSESLYFSLM